MKKFFSWLLPLVLIGSFVCVVFALAQIRVGKKARAEITLESDKKPEAPSSQQPIESALAPSLYSAEGGSSASQLVPQKWFHPGVKTPDAPEKSKASGTEPVR